MSRKVVSLVAEVHWIIYVLIKLFYVKYTKGRKIWKLCGSTTASL